MISGANRGIGLALASALAKDGWVLSLGARKPDEIDVTSGVLSAATVTRHAYDALDAGAHDRWVDETLAAHGRVDCLVNNAGICYVDSFDELTAERLDEMWDVNAKAPFLLTRAALGALRECGEGRIVNVISMSGKRVRGTFAPGYAMSKHAALALHHSVRHGSFGDGVRATAICPGYVQTDMTAEFGVDTSIMIQPDDLATTVAFLLRLPNTAHVAELIVTNEPETLG